MNSFRDQISKFFTPYRIVFLLLYSGFAYLVIFVPQFWESWNVFHDAHTYMRQAQQPLFSKAFFSPPPEVIWAPRPFTVPLFYRLLSDGTFPGAILVQKIFYCFSCVVFCETIIFFIKKNVMKLITLGLLLFYFTWWKIVGWNGLVLSESISQSLMLTWFALLLVFVYKRSLLSFILFIICSILFSFTRDSWPYIVLLSALILLLFFRRHKGRFKIYLYGFFVFSGVLFIVQQQTAVIGQRYKTPLLNVLGVRIACNPDYMAWFRNEGMPDADALAKNYSNIAVDSNKGILDLYRIYSDSSVAGLRQWVLKDGKGTYMKFMLTHPSYFFLADQTPQQIQRIYTQNNYYTGMAKGFFANASNVFPLFNNWITLILVFALILIYFKKGKDNLLLFPVFLIILTIANALLCYNADTLEVERHLYIVEVMRQLACILAVVLSVNALWQPHDKEVGFKSSVL